MDNTQHSQDNKETQSIFKVSVWLTSKGFDNKTVEIKVKERNKLYVGDGVRISKDKLMKIDTIFIENHKVIRYHTYCKEGEQQKALELLKSCVIQKVTNYKAEIDALFELVSVKA